jgi:RNA-directed DNA polymerase
MIVARQVWPRAGGEEGITRFHSALRPWWSRAKIHHPRRRCIGQIAKELSVYLIGRRGYFGFCQTPSVLRALDQWLRRRLRGITWKQWKRGRTRFAELRCRGVSRDLAAQTAGSPHWPLAAQQ